MQVGPRHLSLVVIVAIFVAVPMTQEQTFASWDLPPTLHHSGVSTLQTQAGRLSYATKYRTDQTT